VFTIDGARARRTSIMDGGTLMPVRLRREA